jgi:hypothetical protein
MINKFIQAILGIFTYPANVSKFLEQIYVGHPCIIMIISKPCDEKRLFHLEDYQLEMANLKLTCALNDKINIHGIGHTYTLA